MTRPESPKVGSPSTPKSPPQAADQGGEEAESTRQDEDFIFQVEAEDGEESEAPSESSSEPEPAAPRSTPRGSTSAVSLMDRKVNGEITVLLRGQRAGCGQQNVWTDGSGVDDQNQ